MFGLGGAETIMVLIYVIPVVFIAIMPVIIVIQLGAILSTLKKILRRLPPPPPQGQNRP
jgi:hypothetical protein